MKTGDPIKDAEFNTCKAQGLGGGYQGGVDLDSIVRRYRTTPVVIEECNVPRGLIGNIRKGLVTEVVDLVDVCLQIAYGRRDVCKPLLDYAWLRDGTGDIAGVE